MRCREIEHDAFIDALAAGVPDQAQRRVPRPGQPAGQRSRDFLHLGAREANHADSASPDRRRDRGDGVSRYLIFFHGQACRGRTGAGSATAGGSRMLFTSQYSTRPAGKKKKKMLNTNGMNFITLACTGSGGVGFMRVCSTIVMVIKIGST